jgi:hypothetical protein
LTAFTDASFVAALAVPEPTTVALAAPLFWLLVGARRRRAGR